MDSAAINPDNLLLFSVNLSGLTLSEGLAAYGAPEDPLLPVGEFTRLLDLDVEIHPPERRIVGRIGEARRSLLVDLPAHTARIAGKDVPFTDDDFAVTATEIYLRSSLIAKLLPLKVAIDEPQLAIGLTATEVLPIQAKMERMANRPDGAVGIIQEKALAVATPYRLISPPSADVVLALGAQSGTPQFPLRYDIRAAGDLLGASAQAYVASDELGRPSSARLLLQRRSIEGRLFGPLHGRDLSLGDVFSPGLPIGLRSVSGRGVTMSTVPLDQTNIFNRIDIRGELPPGTDVELYVNDVLRGSTNEGASGRYEFLDVPLSAGVNVVRTVTYGTHGERNEDTRVINVGAGLLRKGEATFEFGAVDQNAFLFNLDPLDPNAAPDTTGNVRGLRVVGSLSYGLAEFLTVTAGAAQAPTVGGDPRQLFSLGGRTSLFGFATQLDLAADSRGGSAVSVGLAGQIRGASAVLRHAEYRGGFIDENNLGGAVGRDLRGRTEVSVDGSLKLRGRILPVSLRAIHNLYADHSYDLGGAARMSGNIGSALLSAGLEYRRTAYRPAAALDELSGYLSASTYAAYQWQLRASLDYDVLPELKARSLSLTADRRLSDVLSIRLALSQSLTEWRGTSIAVSGNVLTRYGDLALVGQYDNSEHDWRIGAQWNFGLGYNPLDRRYVVQPTGPGSGGSLVLDAYVDANGNGLRDADEAAVPDVVVQGGVRKQYVTGANGGVFVSGLGSGPTAQVSVSLDKLDNPNLKTPPATIQVNPRPGSVTRVNYPMQPTGEVMVKLELVREDGKHVGLSSARVQLTPKKGDAVTATTEFDGSAIFNELPAGTYQLELDPKQAQQLRMHLVQPLTVEIKGDGSFTPDVTAQVVFDPASDSAAPAPPASQSAGASAPTAG